MNLVTITKEELKQKIENNEPAQIVNVLSPASWPEGVIKNSRKIPLEELPGRVHELDRNQEVITYCKNRACNASREAAHKLEQRGFRVSAYEGGIDEWKAAGFPLESQEKRTRPVSGATPDIFADLPYTRTSY